MPEDKQKPDPEQGLIGALLGAKIKTVGIRYMYGSPHKLTIRLEDGRALEVGADYDASLHFKLE